MRFCWQAQDPIARTRRAAERPHLLLQPWRPRPATRPPYGRPSRWTASVVSGLDEGGSTSFSLQRKPDLRSYMNMTYALLTLLLHTRLGQHRAWCLSGTYRIVNTPFLARI